MSLRRWLTQVSALMTKEWKQLYRDRALLSFVIFIFTLDILLASGAPALDLKQTPIGIIDRDHSTLSRELIYKLPAQQFTVVPMADQDQAVSHALERGELRGVLTIPHGFEKDLLRAQSPALQLVVDASDANLGFLLSLGTVVLEAALRSGALISARLAAEAGREVFALPGSVDNPVARGCHRLIRDGATLVENPDQVIEALEPLAASLAADLRSALGPLQTPAGEPTGTPTGRSAGGQPGDTADHNRLWSALGHDPTPLDELVRRTGLTVAELSSMLLVMELDGRVVADNGRFARHP